MAEQLSKGLEREGYSVVVANDGEHGLHLARTLDHDLLILDWMLPKLDGVQVARRLRHAGVDTRILMLTARDAPPDVVEGLDGGADDYLIKPFAFEVLLARLRALARRSATTELPLLRVLDLTVDPAAHRVLRGKDEIQLSGKEFSLLHFLIRRAGRTVPRPTLIEAVWGYESSIESNTLDAFIHLLRAKVDAPPHRKLIHTVRGIGYCLRETPPA
jgi:DNA-binding response OmpR family regulator